MRYRASLATRLVTASLGLTLALPSASGAARVTDAGSGNVKLRRVAEFPFEGATSSTTGATDIDFSGPHAYAMQRGKFGGVHIFDLAGAKPKRAWFVHCPGDQNDVAVVRPGLIAVGYHSSECPGVEGGGIRLIDVTEPRSPRLLGAVSLPPNGTHTLTAFPGKPLVYTSTSTGQGIVDVGNPDRPEVVWRLEDDGCHDLTFDLRPGRALAICPKSGSATTEIWDVSNARRPEVVSTIVNPAIYYHHSAVVTADGNHLVIGDEAVGTCAEVPTGALWIYNIEDLEAPELISSWAPSHRSPQSGIDFGRGCGTVHNFNLIPGTDVLVSAWMEGGLIVVDLSDPQSPTKLAHFDDGETTYWSAYFYKGRIYATDVSRGLDVFDISGIRRRDR